MSKRSAALPRIWLPRGFCVLAIGLSLAVAMRGQAAAQDEQEMLMNARGPFKASAAEQFGLPPLAEAPHGPASAEVRIWVWHRGDSDDYLLRLWQIDGRADGELLALSDGGSGAHARSSSRARDWSAVLRDLEAHSVWTIPPPSFVTLCIVDTNLVIESYRDGHYRQVEYAGVRNYHGDVEAVYDYVFALGISDPQIASIGNTKKLGCA